MSNNFWNHIWKAIHILGKTFDPNTDSAKESFVCFFECLVDLLPDIFACKTLLSFIKQYPVERFVTSSDKTFEWTYRLHSYVNLIKKRHGQLSTDISFEKAYKNYSNITKPDWSRPIWFLIHYIAANLPERLSQTQAVSFKAFIVCLRYLLPCEECRYHMGEYINKTEIDPYLITRNTVFYWTWEFHNDVNKRINLPLIKMEDAFNIYRKKDDLYTLIDY